MALVGAAHCGLGALEEVELALRKGRAYRKR